MAAERGIGKGESLGVRAPIIVGAVLAIVAFLVIVAFGLALLAPHRIGVRFVSRHAFPAPAVIPHERDLRLAIEARQRRALEGEGGRMPIGEAVRRIVARGDKAFDPVEP